MNKNQQFHVSNAKSNVNVSLRSELLSGPGHKRCFTTRRTNLQVILGVQVDNYSVLTDKASPNYSYRMTNMLTEASDVSVDVPTVKLDE